MQAAHRQPDPSQAATAHHPRRSGALPGKPLDSLSLTFAALADPTRRALLVRLQQGGAPVKDLAEPFDMTLPAVCKHLRVLERAGLIERGRDAQMRPCTLRAEPLREVAQWTETYRQYWEDRLDRLQAYLQQLQPQPDALPKQE